MRASLIFIIIFSCIAVYLLRNSNSHYDNFINQTDSFVEQNLLDPDILDRLSGKNGPESTPNLHKYYSRYFSQFITDYQQHLGQDELLPIAINEPFNPDQASIHIYILGKELEEWSQLLDVTCNAISYLQTEVIIIDIRAISAFATGQACTEEYIDASSWQNDPSSIIRNVLLAIEGEEALEQHMEDPTLVLEDIDDVLLYQDYWSRQLVPLFIIGHELSHLMLHADGEASDFQHSLSDFSETGFFDKEFEADRFAIDLLVRSNSNAPNESVTAMFAEHTDGHLLFQILGQQITEKARRHALETFVPGSSNPDLVVIEVDEATIPADGGPIPFDLRNDLRREQNENSPLFSAEWECSANLGMSIRLLDMSARFSHYGWLLRKANPERFPSIHLEMDTYDNFYLDLRDSAEQTLQQCNLARH